MSILYSGGYSPLKNGPEDLPETEYLPVFSTVFSIRISTKNKSELSGIPASTVICWRYLGIRLQKDKQLVFGMASPRKVVGGAFFCHRSLEFSEISGASLREGFCHRLHELPQISLAAFLPQNTRNFRDYRGFASRRVLPQIARITTDKPCGFFATEYTKFQRL